MARRAGIKKLDPNAVDIKKTQKQDVISPRNEFAGVVTDPNAHDSPTERTLEPSEWMQPHQIEGEKQLQKILGKWAKSEKMGK